MGDAIHNLVSTIYGDREAVGVVELARKLGVCAATLRRAIKRGDLQAAHVGTALRVSRDDLERHLREKPFRHRSRPPIYHGRSATMGAIYVAGGRLLRQG